MAEYYPLLAKAVGRLPNSTPESRRVVYERARKALIGQLRTQHPPVPDEDIERESVELDRAVERLEAELATGGGATAPPVEPPAITEGTNAPPSATPPDSAPVAPVPKQSGAEGASTGAIGPAAKRPIAPLRTRTPGQSPFIKKAGAARPAAPIVPVPSTPPAAASPPETPASGSPTEPSASPPPALAPVSLTSSTPTPAEPVSPPKAPEEVSKKNGDEPVPSIVRVKPRSDSSRPIAPPPRGSAEPKRRIWIIPVGIGVVVALVAVAAWKLRDRPETIARPKPAEQTKGDSGKIAERVGGSGSAPTTDDTSPKPPQPTDKSKAPAANQTARTQPQQNTPPATNPEIPVAHRAALLVEAPNEPNKVKTFLGTVVWKLNNVPQGASDSVGLAVQADIELPDDKMKAMVTFEKNADASLAASHTIKVQFTVEPGSYTGDVKQISTPQMRPEANPSGDALAGVTVPVVPNTFLVGLSPGSAEANNLDLIRRLQWIDIPILLDNGKIAKLTFEKSDSGQRDLNEAFNAWQK